MALLQMNDISKSYSLHSSSEKLWALKSVSLSVNPGEIVGVVGESGSGKTTLGRCALRLIEPTFGSIHFKNTDILALSPKELQTVRRQMQIVFQDPYASLDPRWRIYEILEEPLRVHRIVERSNMSDEVSRLLTSVGLPADAARRYPHEFSGGQRQRIGIARALAARPELLIADEPVSALDVSVRAQILNLFVDLQRNTGIAVIFVGHDLGVVRQICSRIVVMHKGSIVEEAAANDLFEEPGHPYTRALLMSIPSIKNIGRVRNNSVSSVPGDQSTPKFGCAYRTRCPYAQQICVNETPKLFQLQDSSSHFAACHFKDQLPSFERLDRLEVV